MILKFAQAEVFFRLGEFFHVRWRVWNPTAQASVLSAQVEDSTARAGVLSTRVWNPTAQASVLSAQAENPLARARMLYLHK
ncbi:hypothetical protein [Ureibacillus sp. FSL W8-0352]|uniref:hypothetical protein n=1 Tax=Ureibacillus sp. FSL W8-0352 TaxID=2954596 RepID=UPI0030F64E7E